MNTIFKTFKPEHPVICKYVQYYYLDLKPDNITTEYKFFPHYNNTISIYKNHGYELEQSANGAYSIQVIETPSSEPLHIFTPVRKKVAYVKQTGAVHRIVIVFHVPGVQQFFSNFNLSELLINKTVFTSDELLLLFNTCEPIQLTHLLDHFLLKRYQPVNTERIEKAVFYILNQYSSFSLEVLAESMDMSKRHLNRLFNSEIGIPVKKFHEIVCFRKLMEKKIASGEANNFTQLAHQFHFCDQAHLNNTFEKLTKTSPKDFFKQGSRIGQEDTFWRFLGISEASRSSE